MSSPDIFNFSPPPSRSPSPQPYAREQSPTFLPLFEGPFPPFFGDAQTKEELPERKFVAKQATNPKQIPSPHKKYDDDLVFERVSSPSVPLTSPSNLTAAFLALKTPPKKPAE